MGRRVDTDTRRADGPGAEWRRRWQRRLKRLGHPDDSAERIIASLAAQRGGWHDERRSV